ncbi:hypothetical protein FRC12_016522, partial [Ceratobasidium sp. 428]
MTQQDTVRPRDKRPVFFISTPGTQHPRPAHQATSHEPLLYAAPLPHARVPRVSAGYVSAAGFPLFTGGKGGDSECSRCTTDCITRAQRLALKQPVRYRHLRPTTPFNPPPTRRVGARYSRQHGARPTTPTPMRGPTPVRGTTDKRAVAPIRPDPSGHPTARVMCAHRHCSTNPNRRTRPARQPGYNRPTCRERSLTSTVRLRPTCLVSLSYATGA